MSIFRDFFVKEKPVFTGITRGVGGFGFGGAAGGGGGGESGTATGGTTTTGGSYNYHVYLTSTPAPTRNFTVSGASMTVDYLVIGGGGGGGAYHPSTSTPLLSGKPGANSQFAISGEPFRETTAAGGGGGNSYYDNAPGDPAGSGGSGGGGGGSNPNGSSSQYPAESDTPAPFRNATTVNGADGMSQGFNGGNAGSTDYGGGGGGAGGAAADASGPATVTTGGIGKSAFNDDTNLPSTYGTPGPVSNARYFAAGGGGGSRPAGAPGQPIGGGGAGGGSVDGTPGTANTGSGGGAGEDGVGAGHGGGGAGGFLQKFSKTIPVGVHPITVGAGGAAQNPNQGSGADGIVIIRYQ